MKPITIPYRLEYLTADEVAECVSYQKYLSKEDADALYRKLWEILERAENPTPLGGDGSNGTVEEPAERMGLNNDDKASHWWEKLTTIEQEALVQAMDEYHCF